MKEIDLDGCSIFTLTVAEYKKQKDKKDLNEAMKSALRLFQRFEKERTIMLATGFSSVALVAHSFA